MENNSGLRVILKSHFVYNLFQEIVGGNTARRKMVTDVVCAKPGEKVVEIGCGPAQLLPWLHDVEYIGLDTDEGYINVAKQKYKDQGLFLLGDVRSLKDDERLLNADIVICSAILHHLSDEEVIDALNISNTILKPGGRLIGAEPCWVPDQGFFYRLLMSNDRGQYIRTQEGYEDLLKQVFHNTKVTFNPKPLRIPATGVIIECTK